MHWMDRKTSRSVYYRKNLNIDTYFENLIQEVLLVVDLSVKMKKKKKSKKWDCGAEGEGTGTLLYFWKEGNATQNWGKK